MDFIKRMKKREFIEMALKTICAILASFLAMILMEGMIYGIQLNALVKNGSSAIYITNADKTEGTIAYCIERGQNENGETQYVVLCYNEGLDSEWSSASDDLKTKEECEALAVREVVFHAPNAFIFSITPVHYVVMVVFVLLVAGFFVYRFIALNKSYKEIEDNFKKTGTIEL